METYAEMKEKKKEPYIITTLAELDPAVQTGTEQNLIGGGNSPREIAPLIADSHFLKIEHKAFMSSTVC